MISFNFSFGFDSNALIKGGGVVPPAPTLSALTVSPSSATVGQPFNGTVSGKTSGSTLSLSGPGAAGLSIAGTTISGTPTVSGAVNVVETLAGATNTPRTSNSAVTVAASSIPANEIPWTPAMISPGMWYSASDQTSYRAVDGTQAASGTPVETWNDISGNARHALSAANGNAASSAATRGAVGPAGSELNGMLPLRINSGVLTNRYNSPAGGYSLVSGQAGDQLFIFSRIRPPATAVSRTLLAPSSGNFDRHIAVSGTTTRGVVYAGSGTGELKVDTTERLDMYHMFKPSITNNPRVMRFNGNEAISAQGSASSVTTAHQLVIGNVYGGSEGADCDLFEVLSIPAAAASRANFQRLEGWCAWTYGQQALLPSSHPFKTAPPTVPAGTTSTASDVSVLGSPSQTWSVGFLSEMQTDSFYGGQQPLPADDWAYPRDFTTSELARFKSTFLPGGNYGFHGIRLPLDGFAMHRARETDVATGLIKKSGYLSGVLASLASFLANVVNEGGGVYPEHWGFPPWFKTNPNSGTSQFGYGTLWAGGSYARNITLASIRTTDPTQFNIQVGLITDYIVDVLQYIHASVPVRGYGFFNEAGNTDNAIYGTVSIDDEATYAAIVKRGIEKIRASSVLSTWGGQPNTVLIYANNWNGIAGSTSRGYSLIADAEILATGKTAWQEIALVTDHDITALGNDADSVKSKTTLIATNGKPFCQNEMEHFNQYTTVGDAAYKTPQFRAMNLALKSANYISVGGAIMDVPIIHFTKPIGQTDVDSNTEGYGLTQTRLPSPYGQAPTTPGDTHPEIGHGAWGEIAVNAMGVKPLLNLPKGSTIYRLYGSVAAGQQGFGWISPSGKVGRIFVNRTASASPKTLDVMKARVMKGKRFSYDNGEQDLGTVNASRIDMALPAWSCEVWLEQ